MKLRITLFLFLLALPAIVLAAGHQHPEKWYQERWCADRGRMEVVLETAAAATA